MKRLVAMVIGGSQPLRHALEQHLCNAGCVVHETADIQQAVHDAAVCFPALVILIDGSAQAGALALCERIRAAVPQQQVPLFLLFPADQWNDKLLQADVNRSEGSATKVDCHLLGRAIAQLLIYKQGAQDAFERVECDGLLIDRRRDQAILHGCRLKLSPTELRMLSALVRKPGHVVTRAELARACERTTRPMQPRTVDAHIKSIRRKLEDRASLIETVRGVGYRVQHKPPSPFYDLSDPVRAARAE